jgi:hypothetical protein
MHGSLAVCLFGLMLEDPASLNAIFKAVVDDIDAANSWIRYCCVVHGNTLGIVSSKR